MPCILCYLNVQDCVDKTPSPVPILGQKNPVHAFASYFFKIHFDINILYFSIMLSHQNSVHISPLPHTYHMLCLTRLNTLQKYKKKKLRQKLLLTLVPHPFYYRWTVGLESPHWNMTPLNRLHSWPQCTSNSYPAPEILLLLRHKNK